MTDKKRSKPRLSAVWSEARGIMWKQRKHIALGLVLIVLNRLAGAVLPAAPKVVIDNIFNQGQTHLLVPLALAVLVAATFQAGTSFALSQILGVAAQRVIMEWRKKMQQHIIRLPTTFFDSTKTGVLISRIMTDAEGIRNLVGTGLVQVIGGLITTVLGMGVLFYLNWQITTVVLVLLVIFGLAMAKAFNFLRPVFRDRGEINAQVTGRLSESLGGIRVVKGYTAERREDLEFAKGVHKLFRNVAKSVTGVSAISSISAAVMGAVGVVMIWMGGQAVLDGRMTEGDLITYFFFTLYVGGPLIQIANIATQFSEAFAGLDRIHEIRKLSTEADTDQEREPCGDIQGDVAFDHVWFEYEEGVPVLKDVSFESPAGTTTALVGSSGSGKSTLIGLVMAFHRPKDGCVLVDGRDMGHVRLREYRENLGLVLQENFLFDGTIAENIAFSRPNAAREEIERVGKIAHCHEFITGFEHGYDTIVGERGVKLSGGQRQRVAIARAILADPRILILDEATSSLDSESEAMIQDGLQALLQGRTTFVIAHRLSTIRNADQILVLEHGEIVERGNHDELIALDGRYKELYDRQYQLETNRFINPGEEFTPVGEE